MSVLLFFFLKSMGKVRVSAEDEAKGMDETHHGGKAYEYMSPPPPPKKMKSVSKILLNVESRISIINPYLSDCSIFYDAFKVEIEGRKAHAFLDM